MKKKVTVTYLRPIKLIKLIFPLVITVDFENQVTMKILNK